MKVAIIGCGFIGRKRAQHLNDCELVWCVDKELTQATQLANLFKPCKASNDWQDALRDPDIAIVIIATPHVSLAEITLAAVAQGKHVLVEKPAACRAQELLAIMELTKKTGSLVRVGFNHRYHRAFLQAKKLVEEGELGELMFIRARYGHGGRLGYNKEWRADPRLSGGGELIDQGMHLIDLSRWFLGDFTQVEGYAHTYYWDMPVEDNGFLLLKTENSQVAFLHASCTEWKNTFSFEIYGKKAKLEIQGLGGSYGVERLCFYKMLPEMGPPETTVWEYPMADTSWAVEFKAFLADIAAQRTPQPTLEDAHAALTIVEKICKDSGYDYHT